MRIWKAEFVERRELGGTPVHSIEFRTEEATEEGFSNTKRTSPLSAVRQLNGPGLCPDGLNPGSAAVRVLCSAILAIAPHEEMEAEKSSPAMSLHRRLIVGISASGQIYIACLGEEESLLHPWFLACATQLARADGDMYPLVASAVVAGLPITSLLAGTPEATIWRRAVCGQVEDEDVMRPEQVVYSDAPSVAGVRVK